MRMSVAGLLLLLRITRIPELLLSMGKVFLVPWLVNSDQSGCSVYRRSLHHLLNRTNEWHIIGLN